VTRLVIYGARCVTLTRVQGTVEQLKSVETQQLSSKLDGQVQALQASALLALQAAALLRRFLTISQAELLRVIAHESADNRQVLT
jgi:hypothetical protein